MNWLWVPRQNFTDNILLFFIFFLLPSLFNLNSPSPREKQGNRLRNTELRKQFEKKRKAWFNKVRFPDAPGTLRGLNSRNKGLGLRGLMFDWFVGAGRASPLSVFCTLVTHQDPNGTSDFQLEKTWLT